MTLILSEHGAARLSQRGGRMADVELIHRFGEQVASDRFMITEACLREAQRHGAEKPQIVRLEALRGKLIVVVDGRLISFWHAADSPRRIGTRRRFRHPSAGRHRSAQRCNRHGAMRHPVVY
jgi:hypothetical protein